MTGFSWERLGLAAMNAAALTLVVTLGRLLVDRELDPVGISSMWLGGTTIAYLWRVGAFVQPPIKLSQVALAVLAGVAGILAVEYLARVTDWHPGLIAILLVAAVMAVGPVVSRFREYRTQGE